jgi:inosine-uridine nucleoside N-ribohydrolase
MLVFAAGSVNAQEPRKIIIDTDPAMGYLFRDIDDGLMLVSALTSPELDVIGITTTFGNTDVQRTTIKAREIRDRVGRTDVPVVPGVRGPGVPAEENDAARFIVEQVRRYPGEVTVFAAGPLTNLAAAFELDPGIAVLISEVVAVGGLIETGDPSVLSMPYDLNFGVDSQAVQAILASPVALTLIHIELCLDFRSQAGPFKAMLTNAGDLAQYLLDQTRSWRLLKQGRFVLWDVVGLNFILNPDWYEASLSLVELHERSGPRVIVTVSADVPNGRPVVLPMTMANLDQYWAWLEKHLTRAGSS